MAERATDLSVQVQLRDRQTERPVHSPLVSNTLMLYLIGQLFRERVPMFLAIPAVYSCSEKFPALDHL